MGDAARQVKIKLGVAKRTLKEHDSYGKEIKTQSDKIAKMKSDNADFHDIKQQEEVLKEAEACVVDSKRRLGEALQDLESLVDEHGEALAENADMLEAKKLLEANPPPEN